MPSVLVSDPAVSDIVSRCKSFPSDEEKRTIPLLVWANRSYFDDKSGHRTELGAQFYLCWTDKDDIKNNDYLLTTIGSNYTIAFAPGPLFASGGRHIDVVNGRLTLTDQREP